MNAHPLQRASRNGLDWTRALAFLARERQSFAERTPASAALAAQASEHLLFGVPLHWMNDWGTPFALHVCQASGAQVTDVDSHRLVDFCLGDTGAMFGHAPAPAARSCWCSTAVTTAPSKTCSSIWSTASPCNATACSARCTT